MADTKISALPAATTPLAGTEVLPIVQSSTTDKVSVANLTAGRDVSGLSFTGGNTKISGNQIAATDTNGNMTVLANGSGHLGLGATVSGFALSGIPLDIRDGYRVYDSNSSSFGLRLTFSSNIPTFQGYRETVGATNINLQPLGGDVNFGAGNLVQGTAAKGVNFTANTPASGMTSQLLNWYEQGTWTPTIKGSTSDPTQSYTTQYGKYTRIGNLLFAEFYIQMAGSGVSGGTGNALIQGLPFAVSSDNPYVEGTATLSYTDNWGITVGAPMTGSVVQGLNNIYLRAPQAAYPAAAAYRNASAADVTNNTIVGGTVVYAI